MNRSRKLMTAGGLLALVAGLAVAQAVVQSTAEARGVSEVPIFEVDPLWPKPLPNHWRLGSVIGVWVDDQDVVWVVHRSSMTLAANERQAEASPPTSVCCFGAPPILAFDQQGNLVHSWGGQPGEDYQGYQWPESNHGIFIDHLGFVWLGGNGPGDSHILKFTKDGRVVAQYGRANARRTGTNPVGQATFAPNSLDPENFGRVAKIFVDPQTSEAYVADGYFNRRVAVLDMNTGEMKRSWGAYGNAPDDSYVYPERGVGQPDSQQFRSPVHCADVSNDGLVYVCDRASNRIQVFDRQGGFIREAYFAPATLGSGSTWDLAFSRDPQQRFLFVADGTNERVRVVVRETLEEVTNFGDGGRQPGQFYGVHSIATDSRGNIYTTETYEGKRLQRFVARGTGSPAREQGVVWPR
jgi:DNA-binding beta-propeller fold protein YncE